VYNPGEKSRRMLNNDRIYQLAEVECDQRNGTMRGMPSNVRQDIGKSNYKTEDEEQKAENFLRGDLAKFAIQVYNISMRLGKKCNRLDLPWRLEIVRSYLNQTNYKDRGVLVTFFFECISRRINLYNIPK